MIHSDQKTADSPSQLKRTIADIDAEELYTQFSKMVTVT